MIFKHHKVYIAFCVPKKMQMRKILNKQHTIEIRVELMVIRNNLKTILGEKITDTIFIMN